VIKQSNPKYHTISGKIKKMGLGQGESIKLEGYTRKHTSDS